MYQDLGCAVTSTTAKVWKVEARGSGIQCRVDGGYQVQRSVMGRELGIPGEPEVRGEGSGGHVESES